MVLEDAPTSSDALSSPSAPDSDMDRYSGDQDPTVLETRSPSTWPIKRPDGLSPIYLDFSKITFPWIREPDALLHKSTADAIQRASDDYYKNFGRPYEQSEGQALAEISSQTMQRTSYGRPLGYGAAVLMLVRQKAWKTYRFPGWTPGVKFNPDKFLFMNGSLARAAWHALRGCCYLTIGSFAGSVLIGSYAMTVGTVRRLQDPRLKNINENLLKRAAERSAAKGVPIEDRTEGKRGPESFEMARQRTRAQHSGTRSQGAVDDMSPTGGSFKEDFQGGDQGMLSDSQIQQMQQQEQRSQDRADAVSSSTSKPAQSVSQPSNLQKSSQSASSSVGSSWERLRQQAAQPQTSQSSQQQQSVRGSQLPDNNGYDDFGLSGGNELTPERRMNARQQGLDLQATTSGGPTRSDAQKEFDAQLERERQGQNFEEKSGRCIHPKRIDKAQDTPLAGSLAPPTAADDGDAVIAPGNAFLPVEVGIFVADETAGNPVLPVSSRTPSSSLRDKSSLIFSK